jgi:predicted phage baseplate assembly protein
MALVAPGWQERRVPDLGVTLVELLAYVADHLAYYQDAVATEAYLDTARQRISVRRHGRLVDHVLGEGTNARAFVVVGVDALLTLDVEDTGFVTSWPDAPPTGRALPWDLVDALRRGTVEEFRPLVPAGVTTLTFRPGNDEIPIHTWGGGQCHLAAGTTTATLVDAAAADGLGLVVGDLLVLEEVRGRDTGLPADADPSHRHIVRLVGVEEGYDAATDTSVLEVRWAQADALPFPLCLSTLGPAPACAPITGVAVARANVVPVDHGRWVRESLPAVPLAADDLTCDGPCRPADVTPRAGRFRPRLTLPDLTHAEPLPAGAAAAALLVRDPAAALPALDLREGDDGPRWTAVTELMGSGPGDRHVVVEMDDERVAHLRMGDDRLGEEPEPGTVFTARYRVGNGRSGNVGAELTR